MAVGTMVYDYPRVLGFLSMEEMSTKVFALHLVSYLPFLLHTAYFLMHLFYSAIRVMYLLWASKRLFDILHIDVSADFQSQ